MVMKLTLSAGGVVLNKHGQIAIVSQNGNSWSLPKGHVEEGEDYLTAAKREIYEETGIKELTLVKELGNYERHRIGKDTNGDDISELKTLHFFLFKTNTETLKPVDTENPEARWVEKDKVADLLTHPKDKEFFLKIKDEI